MPETIESTQYINISSQHGTSRPATTDYATTYLSNMLFSFKGLLKEEPDILYSQVDIVNAQIPVSFYNINYTNNILKYSINGGSILTLTLTRSNYSTTSLIIQLKAQFLAAGYTFVISQDRPTGKLTFTHTAAFAFYYSGSTALNVLGFSTTTNYSSTALSLTADYPTNLLGIKKLKFASVALSTNSVGSYNGASTSLIGTVPVNSVPFGVILFDNASGRKSFLRNNIIDEIDIQIYDENNRFINFNNVDWAITLAITTTRLFKMPDGKTLNDVITPILQRDKGALEEPGIVFTTDSDLDFFLYKNGIDI